MEKAICIGLVAIVLITLLLLSGCNLKPSSDAICCKTYQIGSGGQKVNPQYEWKLPKGGCIEEEWKGGGREVVSDSYC